MIEQTLNYENYSRSLPNKGWIHECLLCGHPTSNHVFGQKSHIRVLKVFVCRNCESTSEDLEIIRSIKNHKNYSSSRGTHIKIIPSLPSNKKLLKCGPIPTTRSLRSLH